MKQGSGASKRWDKSAPIDSDKGANLIFASTEEIKPVYSVLVQELIDSLALTVNSPWLGNWPETYWNRQREATYILLYDTNIP